MPEVDERAGIRILHYERKNRLVLARQRRQVGDEEGIRQEANVEDHVGLRVRHSFASAQLKIHTDPTEKQLAAWNTVPKREHPLVWKRKDGRRSLVMGSTAEAVLDVPEEEGRATLQRILEWATQPQFTLSHSWHEGDLVIFDNTGLLHRAMPYSATSQRLMHRATVAGEEAFA